MRGLLLPLVLCLCSLGCPRPGPVLSPTAPSCGNACTVLAHYGCEEAKDKKIGTRNRTCLDRCTTVENTGYVSVAPECVVQNATSLADIRRVCNYVCKNGSQ